MPAQVLLDDIAAILTAASLPGNPWQLFKAWEPPSPDQVVTLYEVPAAPILGMGAIRIKRERVQVRIRGAAVAGNVPDYAPMRAALEPIRDALHLYPAGSNPSGGSGVVSGTQYISIIAISSVMPMGRDENNRPLMTQNFEVTWSY
jgi:Bacteriophage minor capsid protein